MQKPDNCVFPNCDKCTYSDCKFDGITDEERKEQDLYDKECAKERIPSERKLMKKGKLSLYDYNHSEKGKERQKRYWQSEKGKECQKRYAQSEKGKAVKKRYEQSEKGKAAIKRKKQKRVKNGKNAEYCRNYYYRKKLALSES